MKRIAVIGAGISGLVFAHRLAQIKKESGADWELRLFETSTRAGGNIETETRDGFILEKGPDSFVSEKSALIDLCRELGIADKLISTESKHRNVLVVKDGRLHSLPEGFYLIAPANLGALMGTPLFSVNGKLRMAAEMFVPADRSGKDESVGAFIRRRFGREALERLGQPMVAGIYSGNPEQLSVLAAIPRLKGYEKQHGSVTRGLLKSLKEKDLDSRVSGPRYSLFLSFQEGMETLTRTLSAGLKENIQPGSRIQIRKAVHGWLVTEPGGTNYAAEALCLAVSAKRAAALLSEAAPVIARQLESIRYESVATLNLAYSREQIAHPLNAFGLVVPAVEKLSLMACSFSSQKFPGRAPDGKALLRAFIGGAFGKKFFDMEERALLETVTTDLSRLLGITGKPLFHRLSRYPDSLPQHEVYHQERLSHLEKSLREYPGLSLTGASYRYNGISGCAQDARAQAELSAKTLFL